MAERPDFDAIRGRLHNAKRLYVEAPVVADVFNQQVADTAELFTYARELEAEIKRLQDQIWGLQQIPKVLASGEPRPK